MRACKVGFKFILFGRIKPITHLPRSPIGTVTISFDMRNHPPLLSGPRSPNSREAAIFLLMQKSVKNLRFNRIWLSNSIALKKMLVVFAQLS